MKLKRFFSTITALSATCVIALACGPYIPTLPMPDFFKPLDDVNWDFEVDRNITLWQKLTDPSIPREDIYNAVYKMTYDQITDGLRGTATTTNKFLEHLTTLEMHPMACFLTTAKATEEARRKAESPWYYPESRGNGDGDMEYLFDLCRSGIEDCELRDRYGLQGVRLLITMNRPAECVAFYDSVFAHYDDSNLFKQMALPYIAGCYLRMGDGARCDSIRRKCSDMFPGDYNLNDIETYDPDSPVLIQNMRLACADSTQCAMAAMVADRILKGSVKPSFPGDWEAIRAYYVAEYLNDNVKGRKLMSQALTHSFSSPQIRNQALAYKMGLDADVMDTRWLVDGLDTLLPLVHWSQKGYEHWRRLIAHVMYEHWIPTLWNAGKYAQAIEMAGVAYHAFGHWGDMEPAGTVDYRSLQFQLMEKLDCRQLEAVKRQFDNPVTPLMAYLWKFVPHADDFWHELCGTLALREHDYARAVRHLQEVSLDFQREMNIYPYLAYPVWSNVPVTFDVEKDSAQDFRPVANAWRSRANCDNAKLNYARRMLACQRVLASGSADGDRKGIAALLLAAGWDTPWVFTRYSDGWAAKWDYEAWRNDHPVDKYWFLHWHVTDPLPAEAPFTYEQAMAMMRTDQGRAIATYLTDGPGATRNQWAHTLMGRYVKAQCDTWADWLPRVSTGV